MSEIKKDQTPVQQSFGYVDDNDESLRGKSGGKFGLNVGFVTKFEFNPNAGKDEEPADAVDIHVQVGEREYRTRIYDITDSVYGKGGQQIAKGEPGYIEAYNYEIKQRQAVVIHVAKSLGVTDEMLKKAFAVPPADFASWAKVICGLPAQDSYSKPVDIFLEYQWEIPDGESRTYLQMPKNMKGGRFLCRSIVPKGEWVATEVKGGLVYKDGASKEHPFTRSEDFMKSKKAVQQTEGEENNSNIQQGRTDGKKSTW